MIDIVNTCSQMIVVRVDSRLNSATELANERDDKLEIIKHDAKGSKFCAH